MLLNAAVVGSDGSLMPKPMPTVNNLKRKM
jgi:hypothetical protein